jgi:hypothetical protein
MVLLLDLIIVVAAFRIVKWAINEFRKDFENFKE